MDDLSFFEYLSPFLFCQLNFIVLFPFLIKYYHILFIIVFWLGCDRPSGLLFFVPALLFSILTPLFLPPCLFSSVSLSYYILAVPMRNCLGKHSCMSSPFPIAILNGTFFFALWRQWIIGNGALLNKSYYYYYLFFVNWNSLYFFQLLYSTNMLCLLLLYLIGV